MNLKVRCSSFDMYSNEEAVILVQFKPEEEIEYSSKMNILLSNIADITEYEILGTGGGTSDPAEPSNDTNSGMLSITPSDYEFPATANEKQQKLLSKSPTHRMKGSQSTH